MLLTPQCLHYPSQVHTLHLETTGLKVRNPEFSLGGSACAGAACLYEFSLALSLHFFPLSSFELPVSCVHRGNAYSCKCLGHLKMP